MQVPSGVHAPGSAGVWLLQKLAEHSLVHPVVGLEYAALQMQVAFVLTRSRPQTPCDPHLVSQQEMQTTWSVTLEALYVPTLELHSVGHASSSERDETD